MQIYGPAHLHGAQSVGSPHAPRLAKPSSPAEAGSIQDELDISEAGQLLDRARDLPEVRQHRVDQIRAQIANGSYETPEKLGVALDRLLDEIG